MIVHITPTKLICELYPMYPVEETYETVEVNDSLIEYADLNSKKGYAWKYNSQDDIVLENVMTADDYRRLRARDCFPVINRGVLWYNTLSEQQKTELSEWYQAWLDAPQTLIKPNIPEWLKG